MGNVKILFEVTKEAERMELQGRGENVEVGLVKIMMSLLESGMPSITLCSCVKTAIKLHEEGDRYGRR